MNRVRRAPRAAIAAALCVHALLGTAAAQDAPTVPTAAKPSAAPTVPSSVPTTTSSTLVPPTLPTVVPAARVPARTAALTDAAGLIAARNEATILAALREARARAGASIEVLTISSLAEWDADRIGATRFARAVLEAWGIGDVIRHDGAVIVIVKGSGEVAFATGDHYRGTADAAVDEVLRTVLEPAIKRREYTRGIREAATSIARILSLPVSDTSTTLPVAALPEDVPDRDRVPLWVAGASAALALVALLALAIRRRRPRIACPQCGNATTSVRSDRVDGDVLVEGGTPLAAYLAARGLSLRACPVCGHHLVRGPSAPVQCGDCGKPMLVVRLRTTRGATADDPGAVRVEARCASCGRTDERTLSLPALRQGGRVGADHVIQDDV